MDETEVKLKGDRGFMLSLANGKYVIFYNWSKEGQFKCQRYGQNWREFVGDKMIMELCQLAINRPTVQTVDDELKEAFEYHFTEAQEEMPVEVDHGYICQLAAERTIEALSERIQRLADNRKWGHIEEVNKAFFGG